MDGFITIPSSGASSGSSTPNSLGLVNIKLTASRSEITGTWGSGYRDIFVYTIDANQNFTNSLLAQAKYGLCNGQKIYPSTTNTVTCGSSGSLTIRWSGNTLTVSVYSGFSEDTGAVDMSGNQIYSAPSSGYSTVVELFG